MTPPADPDRSKNHRFPGEIISHGVWLYYRFTLSYRDVQELLFERGITVTHEGHAQRFLSASGPIAQHFRPRRHRLSASEYRVEMGKRCESWVEITGTKRAA